jgi:hypothetical protein
MAMSYNTLVAPKGTTGSLLNWIGYTKVDTATVLDESQALLYQILRVREMRTEYTFGMAVGQANVALPTRFLDPIGKVYDTTNVTDYDQVDQGGVLRARSYDTSLAGTLDNAPFTTTLNSSLVTCRRRRARPQSGQHHHHRGRRHPQRPDADADPSRWSRSRTPTISSSTPAPAPTRSPAPPAPAAATASPGPQATSSRARRRAGRVGRADEVRHGVLSGRRLQAALLPPAAAALGHQPRPISSPTAIRTCCASPASRLRLST